MSTDDHTPTPPEADIIDLTEAADPSEHLGVVERIIDLRAPGAPYSYPSSSPGEADTLGTPTGRDPGDRKADRTWDDRIGVARGSADVRTAPPDYTD